MLLERGNILLKKKLIETISFNAHSLDANYSGLFAIARRSQSVSQSVRKTFHISNEYDKRDLDLPRLSYS